jgi:hypothetical protein
MVPPPAVPPGWGTGPPDYVGVGTVRSGTTWWNYLIRCHPEVAWPPRRPKEVHYLDQFSDGSRPADPGIYHAYFPRPEGLLCGEWTPRYMSDAPTAGLLAQHAPAARLLVLLRDPLARVSSAQCVADTGPEAGRTFEFLGLDPGRLRLTARHRLPRNPAMWPKVVLDGPRAERFGPALRSDLRGLARDFPEVDQSL